MIRNPEIQFASADAIAAFQQERLREEIAYLYENSPYYRRMFDHCGARPGDGGYFPGKFEKTLDFWWYKPSRYP